MSAERTLDSRLERCRVGRHQRVRLFDGEVRRVVAANEWDVEARLIGAEVHVTPDAVEVLPQVDDVALVGERDRLARSACEPDSVNERLEVGEDLIDPALLMALRDGVRVNLGDDSDRARDHGGLRLRSAHPAEAGRHEDAPGEVTGTQVKPTGVEHRDGRPVHDALGPDVHVAAGRHLAITRDAERGHASVVVTTGVVRHDHSVGDDDPGSFRVRREEPERVTGVHDQRLFVGHLREVLHREQILCPVLEHRAVSAVRDQLVRVLRHRGVEVVLDHVHDRRGLGRSGGVLADRPRAHLVGRPESVHVDPAPVPELFGELGGELTVLLRREVAQRVGHREAPLLRGE